MHLSIVRPTRWPPGDVRRGWVLALKLWTQGTVKDTFGESRQKSYGVSMSVTLLGGS